MNDEMHGRYQTYLRELADRLLLRDWEIELRREWSDTNAYATCMPFDKENHLWVKLSESFDGNPAEERREWLVHELLHAHFARLDRVVERVKELASADNDLMKLVAQHHDEESEICVQRLARILTPFLPLPPDPTAEPYG
jgi:hypothetical protein